MMNFILSSIFIHGAFLIWLSHSSTLNTQDTSIELIQQTKQELHDKDQKPLKSPTLVKPLKTLESGFSGQKDDKIDLTDYANQLKVLVDPIWVEHITGLYPKNNIKYSVEVLILVDKRGNIKSVKVIKHSGYSDVDDLAVQVFRMVGVFPQPPEIVIEKGLIWNFSN